MKTASEIRELLKRMSMSDDLKFGECKSVDKASNSCTVEVDGVEYRDVRLSASLSNGLKTSVSFPAQNSLLMIARIGTSQQWKVEMYSELESVLCKIENLEYYFDKDAFVFNGGNNKGLVKVSELVDRLNIIEAKIRDIITWSSSHTHTGVTTGGGTSGTAIPVTGTLIDTTIEMIENPKVKH